MNELALFSYGTLQLPQVQLGTYGRLLEGAPDTLPGYRLEPLEIADEQVVQLSGAAVHRIARWTGRLEDRVSGIVFLLSPAELDATDRYEVAAYTRRRVRLASEREAWAYVAASRLQKTERHCEPKAKQSSRRRGRWIASLRSQ